VVPAGLTTGNEARIALDRGLQAGCRRRVPHALLRIFVSGFLEDARCFETLVSGEPTPGPKPWAAPRRSLIH
jgi:hypothetical protein